MRSNFRNKLVRSCLITCHFGFLEILSLTVEGLKQQFRNVDFCAPFPVIILPCVQALRGIIVFVPMINGNCYSPVLKSQFLQSCCLHSQQHVLGRPVRSSSSSRITARPFSISLHQFLPRCALITSSIY